MTSRDKVDLELNNLIQRLQEVREEIGGPKAKTEITVILGEDGLADHFQELKVQLTTRLHDLESTQSEIAKMKALNNMDARERIQAESDQRKMTMAIEHDLQNMDELLKAEIRKKRSKYTKAELDQRGADVNALRNQLDGMKDFARRGFTAGGESAGGGGARYNRVNLVDMKDSELFRPDKAEEARAPKEAVSDEQHRQMMVIQQRDKEIDAALETVGKGVDVLRDLAMQANQEVKASTHLLDDLGDKIDDVQDHMLTINDQLKETLEKVRSGDKLFCDILCVLIMLG